jgi:hypothetical protein
MSAARPRRAQPAGDGYQSRAAAGSAAPDAGFRGTATLWVPTTSPSRLAADGRARPCPRSSSTVGPARCRHGVIDAVTCMIGVVLAWPRAILLPLTGRVGVARQMRTYVLRLAGIKHRPIGHMLLEGALKDLVTGRRRSSTCCGKARAELEAARDSTLRLFFRGWPEVEMPVGALAHVAFAMHGPNPARQRGGRTGRSVSNRGNNTARGAGVRSARRLV